VQEVEPQPKDGAPFRRRTDTACAARSPASARVSIYCRRQVQGDDIDIDAAIEAASR
jgi:hypothetical protein